MTDVVDPESGRQFTEEELKWLGGNLADLRRGVEERRFRNSTLWTALGIGLVVHVAGFLLRSSVTGEPITVLADLLYTLGFALWTGVVVVVIVDIIPAAKERQINHYLDAYEAALRARGRPQRHAPRER
jgi:hypothetical protein